MRLIKAILFASLLTVPAGPAASRLYINEYMASNDTSVSDEHGDHDDWVEIFNSGTEAVDMAAYRFSDDPDDPEPWSIPSGHPALTTIPASGRLLFWFDREPEEGPLHVDIRLDADGEWVLLMDPAGEIVDSRRFHRQFSDVVEARTPDGADLWSYLATPTPGAPNTTLEPDPGVVDFHLACHPDSLQWIKDHPFEEHFISADLEHAGIRWENLRLRLRGSSSLEYPKLSYKLLFGAEPFLDGRDRLNLNAEYKDHSYLHSALAARVFAEAGLPAFAARHIRLHINGEFEGLYLHIENIDEDFLDRRELSAEGNLYKATHDGATLSLFDELEVNWEKKSGDDEDWTDLHDLADAVNNLQPEAFEPFIDGVFDRDALLDVIGINLLIANASTYYHNYYLYRNAEDGDPWIMLPWDLDRSWDYYGVNWPYHHSSFAATPDNPLVERIFLDDALLADLESHIESLAATVLDPLFLEPIIDSLATVLAASVAEDENDAIPDLESWGIAIDDLRTFVDRRPAALLAQIEELPPGFRLPRLLGPYSPPLRFHWPRSEGPGITYRLRVGPDPSFPVDESWIYSDLPDTAFTMLEDPGPGTWYWQVRAINAAGGTEGTDSWNPITVLGSAPQPIINELSYSPGPGLDGGDWVELRNNGDAAIQLGGWRLICESAQFDVAIRGESTLPPGALAVLAGDPDAFALLHPNVQIVPLDGPFEIDDDGDRLLLIDSRGEQRESLTFTDSPPWPVEPAGQGASLGLINPALDGSIPRHWIGVPLGGNPGARNLPELPRIDLRMSPEHIAALEEDIWSQEYMPATLSLNDETWNCELRYRGKSTRPLPKRNWRIKFADGDNPFGRKTLLLNANYWDRSLMRNGLAMDLFHALDYPAPESDWFRLSLNDSLLGVFNDIEAVDEEFLDRRERPRGLLLKGLRHAAIMAPLADLRRYPEVWEIKSDDASHEEAQLLFNEIAAADRLEFRQVAERRFDIQAMLRYFAVEFALYGIDSVTSNYFLHHDRTYDSWEIFPWDNDQILGNDSEGLFHPELITATRLFNHVFLTRCLEYDDWNDLFWTEVGMSFDLGFPFLHDRIDDLAWRIRSDVYLDPLKPGDSASFEAALDTLHLFLDQRASAVRNYSEPTRIPLSDPHCGNAYPDPAGEPVIFRVRSAAPQDVALVIVGHLDFSIWGSPYSLETHELFDDGLHEDGAAGDLIYGTTVMDWDGTVALRPYFFTGNGFPYPHAGRQYVNYIPLNTSAILVDSASHPLDRVAIGKAFAVEGESACIEIVHRGGDEIDLSYCTLSGDETAHRLPFPPGTRLASGDTLMVGKHAWLLESSFPERPFLAGMPWSAAAEETLTLLDPSGSPLARRDPGDFLPLANPGAEVLITEISSFSGEGAIEGDWIEIHNRGTNEVQMGGWQLRDSRDDSTQPFAPGVWIEGGAYAVLCRDSVAFRSAHPGVTILPAELPFGLASEGEDLRLLSRGDGLIDELSYRDAPPWPRVPADGSTLSLLDTSWDNALPSSWAAAPGPGSPGRKNLGLEAGRVTLPWPNPFHAELNITLTLTRGGRIEARLYDIRGRRVAERIRADYPPGRSVLSWSFPELPNGVYLLRTRLDDELLLACKCILLK